MNLHVKDCTLLKSLVGLKVKFSINDRVELFSIHFWFS